MTNPGNERKKDDIKWVSWVMANSWKVPRKRCKKVGVPALPIHLKIWNILIANPRSRSLYANLKDDGIVMAITMRVPLLAEN
jgi:hypothetical protein